MQSRLGQVVGQTLLCGRINMVDLAMVAKLWSAYGVNIIILIILLLIAWIIGLVIQRSQVKGKEGSKKG
jgi:hypothetical protein